MDVREYYLPRGKCSGRVEERGCAIQRMQNVINSAALLDSVKSITRLGLKERYLLTSMAPSLPCATHK